MAENGIDISKQYSKLIDPYYLKSTDLIITLCGDVQDRCPIIQTQSAQLQHWSLPDPEK